MSDYIICPVCGGTLEERTIQLDFRYKGRLVVIEGVPAQVCRDCGEQLISAKTSKDIDALLESDIKPIRQIAVPVLPFRHIAQA
ncbi:MAG: type II toxin-antitoxin system MqsA family antitoxin [Thermoanaerobacteraceae bacterium]|nr:type II toxin-antitoxin system MqsA family antitoxin [Thermoanaerobacteraceae bacterium]